MEISSKSCEVFFCNYYETFQIIYFSHYLPSYPGKFSLRFCPLCRFHLHLSSKRISLFRHFFFSILLLLLLQLFRDTSSPKSFTSTFTSAILYFSPFSCVSTWNNIILSSLRFNFVAYLSAFPHWQVKLLISYMQSLFSSSSSSLFLEYWNY